MPSFFIFACSVVGFSASRSAAPPLPLTRQRVASSAATIAWRSASASVTMPDDAGAAAAPSPSWLKPIAADSMSASDVRMTAR